ncbi:zinc-dependent peptidase, peptidase M16 superfamily [Psychroflexus torquis ATCC 700755]|uniref:Zinc-dependent peptidase, peptidase M16 superfamily n=1 Tax=Psychroflexus torquis (strain ATCC 700755 / CIP 106069 / ACAM 623) TaxID=313595 RepID=K4IGD5_PSYTT|nr:M16 family metallopeptidase [Psychroflexus torquis]AFU68126.1 zinc-dependent peptidase, peptidase M16 superfamily [Psychroflexus torquis ATCC 700755]
MKYVKQYVFILSLALLSSCTQNSTEEGYPIKTQEDANGFSYEMAENDPSGLRLYTLDNGLKVYLGKNEEDPKIQTLIAVRAGSTYDPADNTGLAHYLEHMVFKGTDDIGTSDYKAESKLLAEISDLYEAHKKEQDPEKKKIIYKQIDSVSYEASKLTIANEYDKMVNSLGAEGTNAFTSNEQTVYVNKIPSNELEKWLTVESERFSKLVLRLFHTELEAVYEEFNRGQDSDGRKQYFATLEGLFPTHPYGTQSTIGISEHLKNPSMEAINAYFDKYYVPNNMAVILVGDLDFDATIQKVNDAFGDYERKEVTHPTFEKLAPLTAPVKKEVYGPTSESVYLAFRAEGKGSEQEVLLTLVDYMLANSQAGLIDLNLNQKQVVQNASSYTNFDNDYGFHLLYGSPKENQTLDEVSDLLLEQIEKIKKGEFEDWLLDAVVNDLRLSQIRQYENASSTAYSYLEAFIGFQNWNSRLEMLDRMKGISKEDIVKFANEFYGDNYVEVHKLKGEDTSIVKVENPGITPIELNRDKESAFLKTFNDVESPNLEPQYIDYKTAILETKTKNNIGVSYIKNPNNDIFNLNIIFDMGQDNDRMVSLAAGYLDYLGTDKYTPEELKQEFYKIGINYNVFSSNDKTYVGISGLKENLDSGLVLLENLWDNAKPNQEAYDKYVESILKGRQDAKTQKGFIFRNGMMNYAQYGENSRLRNIYSEAELKAFDPAELVDKMKDLRAYKQRVFYYGNDVDAAVASLDAHHIVPETLLDYPEEMEYQNLDTGGNVYFVDYDMVQSEIMLISKGDTFNEEKMAASRLFNTYFGSGLSSIVFQEIRESKSLAYSAYAGYRMASKEGEPDYTMAYVGTQANKLEQAVDAMMELMNDMPEAEEQFNQAKKATLKQIAAERITKSDIFWTFEGLKKRGITNDYREEMYKTIEKMTFDDLKTFFDENIKGQDYNVAVIGNRKDLDFDALGKLGRVKELDIDYLFNYEKKEKESIKEVKL